MNFTYHGRLLTRYKIFYNPPPGFHPNSQNIKRALKKVIICSKENACEKLAKIYKNCSKNVLTLAFFRAIIEIASE